MGIRSLSLIYKVSRNILVIGCFLASGIVYSDQQFNQIFLDEVITLARKHLGSEELLNNVKSLTYIGMINQTRDQSAKEMILQLKHPYKQRLIAKDQEATETLVSDGYEGFFKREYADPSMDTVVSYLTIERIKKMRITTLENLNFYRTTGEFGAVQTYAGLAVKRGRRCYRLVTQYPNGNEFTRFIDVKDGQLISTKDTEDTEIIEIGEKIVDGIRFPRSLEAYAEGKLVSSITFTDIIVNPELEDSLFTWQK